MRIRDGGRGQSGGSRWRSSTRFPNPCSAALPSITCNQPADLADVVLHEGLSGKCGTSEIPALICWSAEYEIGYPPIDQEHQALVILYNDYVLALERRVSLQTVGKFLAAIHRCYLHHFAHENYTFHRVSHPNTAEHEVKHRDEERHLLTLVSAGHERSDLIAAAHTLRYWIVEHILVDDRPMFIGVLDQLTTDGQN